jgi:hypothetical protein
MKRRLSILTLWVVATGLLLLLLAGPASAARMVW